MAVDTDEEEIDRSSASQNSPGVVERIYSSFPLQLAAAGAVFIAIGFAINTGVWAGMLPIWGFALVLIGLGAYSFIAYSQRGTQG